MSVYTEAEHAIALTDTLYWIDHPPMTPSERYAYGLYHFRLKDYNEAFHWFLLALEDDVPEVWYDIGQCLRLDLIDSSVCSKNFDIQTCYQHAFIYYTSLAEAHMAGGHAKNAGDKAAAANAFYRTGYMLRYGLGTGQDTAHALRFFQKAVDLYPDLTPDSFNITCDYSIEGSGISAPTDICKLPVGSACFELAIYYIEGIAPASIDIEKGRMLLKKAYDFHSEDALIYDFAHFGSSYALYEYQDDIRELFSFRIGQFGRVCDVHPSRKAYLRLIQMYENGYPGDEGQRKNDFALKAKPLYKKMEAIP